MDLLLENLIKIFANEDLVVFSNKKKITKIITGVSTIDDSDKRLIILAINDDVFKNLNEICTFSKSEQLSKIKLIRDNFVNKNSLTKSSGKIINILYKLILSKIKVESENKWTDSKGVIYTKDKTLLIKANKNIVHYEINKNCIKIAAEAFKECKNLESILFPSNLKYIEKNAFYDCSNLTSLELPYSLENIGESVFSYCTNLESIEIQNNIFTAIDGILYTKDLKTLIQYPSGKKDETFNMPDTVAKISNFAFKYCYELKTLNLSKSLKKFHLEFGSLNSLEYINCSNQHLKSINGVLFTADFKTIVHYPECKSDKSYAIPAGVQTIGKNCFINNNIKMLVLPDTIFEIKENALFCPNIEILHLRGCIEYIGESALPILIKYLYLPYEIKVCEYLFISTSYLKKIFVPPGRIEYYKSILDGEYHKFIEEIHENKKYNTAVSKDEKIFVDKFKVKYSENKERLLATYYLNKESYTTLNECKIICDKAFLSSFRLKTLNLTENIEAIGDDSLNFFNFDLEDINVCSPFFQSLNGVLFSPDWKILIKYPRGKKEDNYLIPNGVEILKNYCFKDTFFLESVHLPESIEEIESFAFHSSSIESFTSESKNYVVIDGVLFSSNLLVLRFYPNKKKETIYSVPDKVRDITSGAFYSCKNLTTVNISMDVKYIDTLAFTLNPKLETINVVDSNNKFKSLDGILYSSDFKSLIKFPDSKQLKHLNIIEGVNRIEQLAFYQAKYINSISLPKSISYIDKYAFKFCNLKRIYLKKGEKHKLMGILEKEYHKLLVVDSKIVRLIDKYILKI